MIQPHEIVPKLLEACPGAKGAWDEHVAYWAGEEERGIYLDTAEFVHHVDAAFEKGNLVEVEAFFIVLEDLLAHGDTDTRKIAVLGLIETLQNFASHSPHGYHAFEKWLGPLTRVAWSDVERMWAGNKNLADVIRAERKAGP